MLESEKIILPKYINIPLTKNNPYNTIYFLQICVYICILTYINQCIYVCKYININGLKISEKIDTTERRGKNQDCRNAQDGL